jgi:hypothetical protein
VPLLLGDSWERAVPALMALAVYGVVTTAGGIFGPLYRALNRVGWAVAAKGIALVLVLPPSYELLRMIGGIAQINQGEVGALGGAWMINGLYLISIGLTALFTLPALYRKTYNTG